MKASNSLIEQIIKPIEGFRARPYLCPAGIPTIGYGSTHYPDGRAVTLSDPPITDEQASAIMLANLPEYEAAVNRYVQVPLTQGQFDALVDFCYNDGPGNLRTSTLLKLVNAKQFNVAAGEFGKWVYGGGIKQPGLVRRRELERELFLS